MTSQVGDRYKCSDPDCGCEVEITSPSRTQNQNSMGGSMSASSEQAGGKSIGGSATGETGVGSLRNSESQSISTPGDFGSQGATGEGVFGTSGGSQRTTTSGRFGSGSGALRSGAVGSAGSGTMPRSNDRSSEEMGLDDMGEEESFFCFCGEPMRKSTGSSSRAARA
jgi:hypothetical protein